MTTYVKIYRKNGVTTPITVINDDLSTAERLAQKKLNSDESILYAQILDESGNLIKTIA